MPTETAPTFLLASPQPALLAGIEHVLERAGARVEIVQSAEAALAAMAGPPLPSLALLDERLTGTSTERLLAHALKNGKRFPIVLLVDEVTQESIDRLTEGVVDNLILRSTEISWWQLRMDRALRTFEQAQELDSLREAVVKNSQMDHVTSAYNRQALLSMLFRETDRAQRLNTAVSLLLFDIDDFSHWNLRLGAEACDELLYLVAARTSRLLRSYDLLGRPGMDEFLVALPGCGVENAIRLAERLRIDVFSVPFHVADASIRLTACFGIASSQGRSPLVVLREAEEALQQAKTAGPESIRIFGASTCANPAPVALFSSDSSDEIGTW